MSLNDKYHTVSEWAEAYKRMGWQIVPLYSFGKSPQGVQIKQGDVWVNGWKELQERPATTEEFQHWFYETKPTGLGVITGKTSGIVVVDEDSYKKGGMRFHLSSPWQSRTGRGGTHHFFKYNDAVSTKGLQDGVFIEIKSDGGFIVLPPTTVWTDEKMTIGLYQWIKAACRPEDLPLITPDDLSPYHRPAGSSRDMHSLIEADLGTQHNNLRTIANKMFARFPKNEWDIAANNIRDMARRFNPPHPQKRVEDLIKSCSAFIDRVGAAPSVDFVEPKSIGEVSVVRKYERQLEDQCPSTGFPELDQLIKGFIPGHLYTLTGQTNVGKSSIACNFAVRVTAQGKRVLYYSLEPDHGVVDFLASIRTGKRFGELRDEDISFTDDNLHIYTKEQVPTQADLLRTLSEAQHRYDLVIVDHIGYFIRSKEGTNQEQSNLIKELVGLAKEKQMAIMIIAHLRKTAAGKKTKEPTADDISGSAAFKQDSTDVMVLSKEDGDGPTSRGILSVLKSKSGPNGKVEVVFSSRSALIYTLRSGQNALTTQSNSVLIDENTF